jgi:phosphoribosylglycinamide formyltransferase-1
VSIGVLVSGTGTILTALLEEDLPISVVVADRACRALGLAVEADIPAHLVERPSFGQGFDRLQFTHLVVDALQQHGVGLVAMAGFGTVLEKPLFDAFPGRVLNTHPALLPAFPGWHAVEEALTAGVKVTGCTVHVATVDVDAGPILAQEAVPVLPGDTVGSLHERIKEVERRLYPRTVKEFLQQ